MENELSKREKSALEILNGILSNASELSNTKQFAESNWHEHISYISFSIANAFIKQSNGLK